MSPRDSEYDAIDEEAEESLKGAGAYASPLDLVYGTKRKVMFVAACLILAVLSGWLLGNVFSNPETYASTIASLDEKAGVVTGLASICLAIGGAVSLIPGDAGTPIAEQLVNLGADFMIVLGVIYLEKYLLTIFGMASCRILIPLALVLLAVGVCVRDKYQFGSAAVGLCSKFFLMAVALLVIVPGSTCVSDAILDVYEQDMAQTVDQASVLAQQDGLFGVGGSEQSGVEQLTSFAQDASTSAEERLQVAEEVAESGGVLSSVGGFFVGLWDSTKDLVGGAVEGLTDAGKELIERATAAYNDLVEAMVVLILVNCAIPILVLVFFLWLINNILGANIKVPRKPRIALPRKDG